MHSRSAREGRLSISLPVLLALIATSPGIQAADDEPGRLYRTREEQRETGLQRPLTPWLSASGLLELEWAEERLAHHGPTDRERGHDATVQLGLIATPWENVTGEAIFEYDSASADVDAEETTLGLEHDPWEIVAGRMYVPFGVFISHFASGALLEFGETRATAVEFSFDLGDRLTVALSGYRGQGDDATDSHGHGSDGVIALESWPLDTLSVGASYTEDLADADGFDIDADRNARKVGGWSGYLMWVADRYELSFEVLGATRRFKDVDPDRDQPRAWNLEYARFLPSDIEWALRVEGSDDLEDAPRRRYGTALTWRAYRHAALTLEYLYGCHHGDLAVDEDDRPYRHIHHFGAQVAVAF